MTSPFCLSVYPLSTFWMAEPIFLKLGMYNMTTDPILQPHNLNPSRQFVPVFVTPYRS
jgi:hypothetical protein